MTDAEIKILIEAVDNATKTLERIEKSVVDNGKEIRKQTEKTSEAFDKQMGSLLVLGNAASSVDRVWSSYQNLQLRLENASERVTSAQERLADAQEKLIRLQKKGKASAEELADAQKEVDRASRSLTISQNNQARAQNQVIGTYISMAMQGLVLVKSYSEIKKAIDTMTAASLKFIATPIGATIAAIALVALASAKIYNGYKEALEEATTAQEELDKAMADLNNTTQIQNDALAELTGHLTGMFSEKSSQEIQLEYQILDAKARQSEIDYERIENGGLITSQVGDEYRALDKLIKNQEIELKMYKAKRDAGAAEALAFQDEQTNKINGVTELTSVMNSKYNEQKIYLKENYYNRLNEYEEELIKKMEERIRLAEEASQKAQANAKNYGITTAAKIGGAVSPLAGVTSLIGKVISSATSKKKNDFVMRPGQPAVSFSSDDTLIGMKNPGGLGGGMSITITGNIYGTDPDEIAGAIMNKLRKKIAI